MSCLDESIDGACSVTANSCVGEKSFLFCAFEQFQHVSFFLKTERNPWSSETTFWKFVGISYNDNVIVEEIEFN